eukprot:COSAG02_NODE_2248_length_9373_cov_31.225361_1_plen_488_part_00
MIPWDSATPSFAAPISRGGGSTNSRKSRGGGSGGAGAGIGGAAKAVRGVPAAVSARNPPASARRSSDSAIWPRRSPQQQTVPDPELEGTLSNTSEAIDGHAATEITAEITAEDTSAPGDGAAAEEQDGVQNRDALAAAMDAERQQLAEMFDEIDASGASGALEAVALANAEHETSELEQDVQQLKQSIAGIKSPKSSKFPRAAGDEGSSRLSSELLPPRLGTSRSVESINGVKGVHGLSDAFNYGQATHGVNAIDSGRGARGGPQAQQGRNAKQRLNSIKSKQGGVSNMPPMFGMRPHQACSPTPPHPTPPPVVLRAVAPAQAPRARGAALAGHLGSMGDPGWVAASFRLLQYTIGSFPDFATNLRYDSESPTSSATTRIPGTFLHRPKITTFRQTRTRICHDFKYLPRFTCLLTPISRIPDRPPRIPISGRSLLRFVNYEICNSQNRDLFRIPSKFTHIRRLLPHLAGPVVSRIRDISFKSRHVDR